ncbi:Apolipoprotein C-I [Oryzias melastigma]|uniref:Apolipoprotein C-I n=1 Tax=Oryzias melastigma TaxID=30732 RepID=A0A834BMV4_ORYME|nr:Apolipoprotein C-I [Oryzias melastigma]
MKLYLAVAVLMLAFVAYTEAQEADATYTKIRDQLTEFGKTFAEKAKTTFDTIQTSEFAETTRNWFTSTFDKLKTKFDEMNN